MVVEGLSVCVDLLATGGSRDSSICVNYKRGSLQGFSESPRGEQRLELRGQNTLALPGVVDIHVHLRGLQLSYKEDEYTGTAAAASGCVTLVADMPNTSPPLRSAENLSAKLRSLSAWSVVDYTVYAGVPWEPGDAWEMASRGVAGFKIYPEDLSSPPTSQLCEALRAAERMGLLVVLHPENPELFRVPDMGFERSTARSCESEEDAVRLLSEAIDHCGAKPRVHVTHASCPGTVARARSKGYTVDVTPHHLFLDEETVASSWGWCLAKVNPPLRGPRERGILQSMLLEGLIDAIASDHAPHNAREKLWLHPSLCSPGYPWLEWWPGFAAYRLLEPMGPSRFADLTSHRPREILGVRGPGPLDSLSVLSLRPTRIYPKGFSKAGYTPALGMETYDCLVSIVRGRLVYFRGRLAEGVAGHGRMVSPLPEG